MQWYGRAVAQNRFLGLVDSDDATNLPPGLASLCNEFEWTRDSAGPTCANSRCGQNTAMVCVDPNTPVTGLLSFVYQPESATDVGFQFPTAFQPTVGDQYENPVGSGKMALFPQTNFQEPNVESVGIMPHLIQAGAGNKIFGAYSDLLKPVSGMSTRDPKAKTLNPFGLKPFGWYWVPNQPVLEGEVCCPPTPANGNGHTYQAQNSGTTGGAAPVFPTVEGATVNDNNIVWKEKTMVIANRLPPPPAPALALAGAGTFASGLDIYFVITFLNTLGETLASIPVFITTIAGSSSVNVTIPALASLPGWIQSLGTAYIPESAHIYVASVTHGSAAPALSSYQLGSISGLLGGVVNVTAVPTGVAPPTACTARVTPGQLPTPVVEPNIQRIPAGSVVPPPAQPAVSLVNGAGSSFTGGQFYYVGLQLINANGTTTIGDYAGIVVGVSGQGIKVNLAANYGPTVTGVNVWISTNPVTSPIGMQGPYALGASPTLLGPGPTTAPPASNTATLPASSFAAGRDVYVAMTYTDAAGETPLGPANSVINTNANDGVLVNVAVPLGPNNAQLYQIASVGIYEADVPTGQAAPPASAFSLVGYYQPLATPIIENTATGANPPTINTSGLGGAIAADSPTGGPNGTQGYRYAACMFINQMQTFSGFTLASVVSTIIDLDGFEIGCFNIPTGMPNVIGRAIAFAGADETQAGPFNYIGVLDILAPAQNVVYPAQTLNDGILQSSTIILDNVTTQALFNFSDSFLESSTSADDRLTLAIPPQGVRIDYLESQQRLVVTGVPGLSAGAWISLAADFESFDAANSPVTISAAEDVCYGVTDAYKGIPFALMKSGGFVLEPNTGNPLSWASNRRWGGVDPAQQLGPCGFRAWCACGKFIIFAHRSGLYKYDQSDPDMMSKEIPRLWSTINWAAGQTISVTIDEDTHTVRVLVPTGASVVPNKEFVLSYIEGWNNPIHFSTFSGREISMDAARRWSPHTKPAFLCARFERTLPPGGNAFLDGPVFTTLPDSSFGVSQLLYASSAPDGTVQARTPGIFSDNGAGIDYQYEPMSSGLMQAVCKPEGMNLNACGSGILIPSFVASRAQATDEGGETELVIEEEEVTMDPIALTPKQISGITRKCGSAVNEFWRPRFRGNGQPGSWVSLKAMTSFMILVTPGRDPGDQ